MSVLKTDFGSGLIIFGKWSHFFLVAFGIHPFWKSYFYLGVGETGICSSNASPKLILTVIWLI